MYNSVIKSEPEEYRSRKNQQTKTACDFRRPSSNQACQKLICNSTLLPVLEIPDVYLYVTHALICGNNKKSKYYCRIADDDSTLPYTTKILQTLT